MNKASTLLLAILGLAMSTGQYCYAFILPATAPVTPVTKLFASSNFVGPVQEMVEETLQKEFSPTYLQVINESHGQLQDESHFKVIIVSDAFQDKRLVQRHRLINASLMKDGQLPFHALTITAKTTNEWDADSSVPESPACMGGH
jgi:stress-induced morphogen